MKRLFFLILVAALLLIPTTAFGAETIQIHSWSPIDILNWK